MNAARRQRIVIFVILLIVPAINLSSMTQSRLRQRVSEIGVRRACLLYTSLLDAPTGGTIEIAGTKVDGMKDKELAAFRNRKLGFVFPVSYTHLDVYKRQILSRCPSVRL